MFCVQALAVFATFLLVVSAHNEENFRDVWTDETNLSFDKCKANLPQPLTGEDMAFGLKQPGWYLKYIDQISLSRMISAVLDPPSADQTLASTRCLYESPCLVTGPLTAVNGTIETCVPGAFIQSVPPFFHRGPAGTCDGLTINKIGQPVYKFISIPVFTDRRTFVINLACTGEGVKGFTVLTTLPDLSDYERHLVKDYLDNAGFKDHMGTMTSYIASNCQNRVPKIEEKAKEN